ncbi:hypothetical protein [Helicobacter sp. T3_23-1056]
MKKVFIVLFLVVISIAIIGIMLGNKQTFIFMYISGLVLGLVWFVVIFLISIYFIIKTIEQSKLKSPRLQKVFRFLSKSIMPLFLFLFIAGGGTTAFVNPYSYWCIIQSLLYNKHYEYNLYGIFIEGNEGSGFEINFKQTKL